MGLTPFKRPVDELQFKSLPCWLQDRDLEVAACILICVCRVKQSDQCLMHCVLNGTPYTRGQVFIHPRLSAYYIFINWFI